MKNIYGRNTKATKIPEAVAIEFTKENHRDSVPRDIKGIQTFGLYTREKELVAVAIIGNPRTKAKVKKYSSELVRLTFKKNVRVVGGASKLLKYIMKNGELYDLFTYQDTSGDASDVYELAGMRLVSQSKTKEYLVKDGKTLETAERNERFSVAYVVRYGPDRILGTNLGQDTGKTNKELFLECGYHIESTTGDRVYEWFNPNYKHYIYKITSIDNDGFYYIGMRSAKDVDNDEYMGSGGMKFVNWKRELIERLGTEDVLKKEILSIHKTRAEAFDAERIAISDKYKVDPKCLNAIRGGVGGFRNNGDSKIALRGVNDLESQNPQLSKEFDMDRNYPLKPYEVGLGSALKVWWTCDHGHSWESEVRRRNEGFGCPFCAGQRAIEGENDLLSKRPDIAKQLVSDVDPTTIAYSSHQKLEWQCEANPKHRWIAGVDSRVRGRGCPYCSGNKVLAGDNDFPTTRPDLMEYWSKKNTIDPTTLSEGSNIKCWWICEKGHEYDMAPAQKRISGCPICSNKRVLVGYNDFKSQHPELMREWSDKNTLDPETVMPSSTKKVLWKCEHGHEWERPIRTRVRHNSICPECKKLK